MYRMLTAAVGLALAAAALPDARADEQAERLITIVSIEHDMRRHVDRTPFPDTLEQHPDLTAGGS